MDTIRVDIRSFCRQSTKMGNLENGSMALLLSPDDSVELNDSVEIASSKTTIKINALARTLPRKSFSTKIVRLPKYWAHLSLPRTERRTTRIKERMAPGWSTIEKLSIKGRHPRNEYFFLSYWRNKNCVILKFRSNILLLFNLLR